MDLIVSRPASSSLLCLLQLLLPITNSWLSSVCLLPSKVAASVVVCGLVLVMTLQEHQEMYLLLVKTNTCQQTSRPLLYMLSCVVPLSQLFPAMIKPREIRWLTAGFIWLSVAVTSEEISDDTSESETGGVRTRLNIT